MSLRTPIMFLAPGELRDGDLSLVLVERFPGDESGDMVPAYRFEMRVAGHAERVDCINLRIGDAHVLTHYRGQIG